MDLGKVVSELKRERDRLDKAIAALEGLDGTVARGAKAAVKPAVKPAARKKGKHYISPEGRKRLSEMMKKRWADRRRKLSAGHRQSAKAA